MGGQQFGEATRARRHPGARIACSRFDAERGRDRRSRAASTGRELVDYLERTQPAARRPWGIVQKQTGADRLSLGGALACNAHGRGLTLQADRRAGRILRPASARRRASHAARATENAELFRLAIGGYGLFGVITRVRAAPARRA